MSCTFCNIAKLQIQPDSGGLYIRLIVVVVVVVVGTLRLYRQEQTRLSPDQTILDKVTRVDLPDTRVDLPDTMVDLLDTMVDLPDIMVDLPDTMRK